MYTSSIATVGTYLKEVWGMKWKLSFTCSQLPIALAKSQSIVHT
jgi:hypothetical protein